MWIGEIIPILQLYQYVTKLHDVGWSHFKKTEEHHVQSLAVTLLENSLLHGSPEYAIKVRC